MKRMTVTLFVMMMALAISSVAFAASTVVVTPQNPRGWTTADTRPGGLVTFVADPTAPRGHGALQLTTDATTTAKAQYMHAASTPLARVTELSYYTKQVAAIFPQGDPSYQLPLNLNGDSGFTTMVFEPYENLGNNGNVAIIPNTWQRWNVAAGQFWSTRTVVCTGGPVVGQGVTAGFGGAPFYTLAQLKTMCPKAVVIGYGVNIGSNNPGYNVETDLFNFNGRIYDFEPSDDQHQGNQQDDQQDDGGN
ncbi:MAG: hypothetical protein NVS4B8_12080 [Herpetosiphon sp.]